MYKIVLTKKILIFLLFHLGTSTSTCHAIYLHVKHYRLLNIIWRYG